MNLLGIPNLYDTPIIKQGMQFKRLQEGAFTQKSKSVIEGFGETSSTLPARTQSDISSLLDLQTLKTTYDGLIQQYQATQSALSTKADVYMTSTSSVNAYAGKNVLLTTNGTWIAWGYVTQKGVFKQYMTWDDINATSGQNGCASVLLNQNDTSTYSILETQNASQCGTAGTVLSKNPRIVSGTQMLSGQTCGNENTNVFVTDTSLSGVTYSGCYKDSSAHTMTYQTEGSVFTYESCGQRASDTNSQYFALQNYQTGTSTAQCYVGNDYTSATSLGSADSYPNTNLWNTTHSSYSNCYSILNNDGNFYMYDSSGNQIGSSATGSADCALVVPTNIVSTWGGNVDNIENGNNTSYLQKYNNGSQTFSYVVGAGQSDPAKGTKKTFDLSYQCGTKIKTKHVKKEAKNRTVILDCSDSASQCQCYLILKDGGQAAIYKGSSPGANDQVIYAWPVYDVSGSTPNPSYPQNLSKTGANWIPVGTRLNTVQTYEYVVSDDGKLLFFLGNDGNLYLSTFAFIAGCPIQSDTHAYGGSMANALFSFGSKPNNDSVGNIGYVDDSGDLRVYSSDAVGYTKKYTEYKNYDSGTTVDTYLNSDAFACKIGCSNSDTCGGFVFDNNAKTCYIKGDTVYPKSAKTPKTGFDLYIRGPKINNSNSCSKEIVEIDSDMWKGYKQGSAMGIDDVCGLGHVLEDPRDKLSSIQSQLDDTVSQMKDKFSQLQQDNVQLNGEMIQLQRKIGLDLNEYKDVSEQIRQKEVSETTVNSMLNDSHLVVLRENYKYTFLSVLAIGALVIAMNVGKPRG